MIRTKKHLVAAIALLSIFTLVITGVPFGKFSDVAFADLYGSHSINNDGVVASASANGQGVCIARIDRSTIVITPGVAQGTGNSNYQVVKNVVSSQSPNYRVVQVNNADNTMAYEIWLNLLTGDCAILAL